jgi:hypothetical protein
MIVFCGLALFGLGMAGGFVLGVAFSQRDKDEKPVTGWPPRNKHE